jgi:hypothetical protein
MSARAGIRAPGRRRRVLRGLVVLATASVWIGTAFSAPAAEPRQETVKSEAASDTPAVVNPGARPHRVIAYYFHGNYRCASCRAIEANARQAIESAFARELEDGRLVWLPVNVEVKGNEHFVKDFKLYTKSVVLVNEVRGKAAEWKNLEKVWQLLRDKPRFLRYVQDETRAYLARRP